ncbi:fungal-specific transcription factor domain-containing protein [Suillus clintonianus]|uniref:fungal-specific transcription factor domain-containing protein n=1 Tax=Suillus clintonianus TaxID=1904413 RepID=UPI001B861C15|nr:fungal-specific transcription factor domain-containing protein [Suillus clintonianus]KAG2150388.1 fungal-specific transcription factor domain-containing protein [Suillus clintonianus]
MHPTRPYYSSNVYSSNVVDIGDPYVVSQQPMASTSMVTLQRTSSYASDQGAYKKRKIERACDACRRRKTKCDGPRMPDNICTNCVQNRKTCSYIEASKPRGPPKAYITGLEDRLERMEALLKRLRPEADFSEELGSPVVRDSWKRDAEPQYRLSPDEKSTSPVAPLRPHGSPSVGTSLPPVGKILPSSSVSVRSRRSAGTPRTDTDLSSDTYTSSESEEIGELSLSRGMKRLTIRGLEPAQEHGSLVDSQVRFHGKSSCFKLIEPTRKLREEHMNRIIQESCSTDVESGPGSRNSPESTSSVSFTPIRRPEFWTTPSWEFAFEGFQDRLETLCHSLTEEFPPPDLADSLINLFFLHINPQCPLFHRPTFERQWQEGLQETDPWFGCLCLSLFAVASRWCDDPRVLDGHKGIPEAEIPNEDCKWQRAGWKYFNAAVDVHRDSRSLFHPPGLFEVQTMSLLGMFLRGTAFHPVAWLFISTGLRKAQDVGAHRKKIYGAKPGVEEELWKRAFWVLVLYDRIGSAALGRPCCSGEEDFDVDLPLEVDDEYWETEDPEKAFQQPPGKPSKIAAFNSYLKLTKISAYALRTIYALDRSKLLVSAARPRWQEVLNHLSTAMTEWVDSVPPHLQWSPHMEDPFFANQSVTLYTTYYLIHILIYRPFLPGSLRSLSNAPPHANMPVPCIAVCVNAAKSCAKILRSQIQRGISNIPTLICGSHMCAAILLMNFWDLKWQERKQLQSGGMEDVKPTLAVAMAELLEDVSFFIQVLEHLKPRWRNAEMYLKDLGTSMPHRLNGTGSGSHKDNLTSQIYGGKPEHLAHPPDYRPNPPSAYHPALPPVTTYPYISLAQPVNNSPQWFDFPHLTRHPVPGVLPLWASHGLAQGGATPWSNQLQTRPSSLQSSPHKYDHPAVHHSLEARKASVSSLDSGIMIPSTLVHGSDTRMSCNERPIPRPQYELANGPPYSHYTQHSGNGQMRADAAHHPYATHSETRYGWPAAEWEQTYGPRSSISGPPPPRPSNVSHPKGSEYSQGHLLSYPGHH